MTFSILLSMISFAFVLSITPGPVNIMIISSGINNGFKQTFAFISGATIGFTLLLLIIGFGLSNIFLLYPNLFSIMEIFGALFIMYIGYKIVISRDNLQTESKNKQTLKFYEGFLLQWINPKAWIACISGVSMYITNNNSLLIFVIIYFIVCYLSLSFWGIVGEKATIFFSTQIRLKIFNILMGSILIFSSFSLFISNIF